ncbi:bromodomain adjacent to zinc finger domain protein 1A [Elysia marginata]|uniref:Bromodomain adjacent to zinc finger domain protein 1A n=1 Tax=Elysia marginata TaxID=1093978 RepID=A0AAV4H5S7_9GAST|nr:bromodomain adjacent to zinc finger domain protein 1A [Elysia marginata]
MPIEIRIWKGYGNGVGSATLCESLFLSSQGRLRTGILKEVEELADQNRVDVEESRGMTFQEAKECEDKAKKNLANFQDSLKKPLLFLTTLTHRSRLNDLNDDVFLFAKDRFFIGETLEYSQSQGSKRIQCKILEAIPPPEPKPNGDIIVIDDSDDSNQAPSADTKNKGKNLEWPEPSKFSYRIKLKGSHDIETVPAITLSRKKGLYSRERSKLFVKQHCEPVEGLWKVKESTLKKLNLKSAKFEDFFAGPIPQFEVSVVKRIRNAKRPIIEQDDRIEFEQPPPNFSGKTMRDNKGQKVYKEPEVEYVPLPTAEDKAMMKEKIKQQKLEEKRKTLEEKEAKKEELRRQFEAEKLRRKEEKDKPPKGHRFILFGKIGAELSKVEPFATVTQGKGPSVGLWPTDYTGPAHV